MKSSTSTCAHILFKKGPVQRSTRKSLSFPVFFSLSAIFSFPPTWKTCRFPKRHDACLRRECLGSYTRSIVLGAFDAAKGWSITRWWQLKYFWNVHPEIWGRCSFILTMTHIFQMGCFFNHLRLFQHTFGTHP